MTPQIIEIQPLSSGWQVREAPASRNPPFFTGLFAFEHAIAFAWEKAAFRVGEIRVLARTGEVITTMPFGKTRQGRGTRKRALQRKSQSPNKKRANESAIINQ
jgi:hypothetical protein